MRLLAVILAYIPGMLLATIANIPFMLVSFGINFRILLHRCLYPQDEWIPIETDVMFLLHTELHRKFVEFLNGEM